jgi:hypothetical protein
MKEESEKAIRRFAQILTDEPRLTLRDASTRSTSLRAGLSLDQTKVSEFLSSIAIFCG